MPAGRPHPLKKGGEVVGQARICTKCGKCGTANDFHIRSRTKSDGTLYQFLRAQCKECVRKQNRERMRQRDPNKKHDSHLKLHFGITQDDYESMLVAQKGRCRICGSITPGQRNHFFCVDHCHSTGEVRGLLCDTCNKGLGQFQDKAELLEKAAAYLRQEI